MSQKSCQILFGEYTKKMDKTSGTYSTGFTLYCVLFLFLILKQCKNQAQYIGSPFIFLCITNTFSISLTLIKNLTGMVIGYVFVENMKEKCILNFYTEKGIISYKLFVKIFAYLYICIFITILMNVCFLYRVKLSF